MYRKFLSVLFIFISILTVNAKDYPHLDYNLSSRDKESIAKIQAKMQHIRETEHRPTVGLVLSGGGAKGAAHIGVLRYLEEQHIPIDIITGASMGTLMGTLYCVGYSPEEMEHMINIADWDALIQDVIPSYYYTVEHREYKASVILDMPFYRGKDGEKVKLGMPSSLVPGMNVESYFASVLAGYTGREIDFADLDIPLGCVATDIKNAVPKTFLNGDIVTAARSSMSIPGMFTPKKVGESTLVDGGLIDNFPATLARDMGADIVIGVDLSSSLNSKDIEDLGSIIGAMIDLAETPRHKVNNENCDFIIYPDVVKDFGMLSFDRKSIKEIISRGYSSAEACGTDLAKCLEDKGLQTSEHYYKERRHAVDVHNKWVNISSWELSGIQNDFDRKYILSLVEGLLNSHIADKEKLDDIVARIYAKGAFDSVTWELIGAEEPYGLRINCTPGKKHQIGMGVRFDTEEVATIDLHFGYNYHKLAGNKLNFFGRISANPQIKLSYSLDLPKMPTLNAEAKVRWASSNVLRYGSTDNQFRNFSYFNTNAKIFISYFEAKKCTFQVGAAYDYYQLLNRFEQALDPAICDGINLSMNNWKVYGRINLNTLDDINNPRKGVLFNVGYECDIRPRLLHIASLKLMTPINFKSKRFTLTPTLVARAILGQTYENTPCFHLNLIGGEVEGRYIDNQMAFTGLQVSPMGNLMAMAKLDARVMVYENVYVSARANYAACIKDVQSIKTRPADWHHDVLGCGLEGAFITRYGSVKALFSYNTLTKKVGFYASFGKCF